MEAKTIDQTMYLIGLTKIANLGPKTCRNLIAFCGGAEEVFRTPKSRLLKIPGIGRKTANTVTEASTVSAAEAELEFASKHGIEVISYVDDGYPAVLKASEGAPLVIYKRGELCLNSRPSIAVVGTRRPSQQGREWARRFARFFSLKGFNVVSGLAYGIDSEAHDTAISAGGVTTAVLAHGLDMIYPRQHYGKASRILETGGAWVTEFPSGTNPDAYNFPARNRIISGLCHATLVVEARKKGGAQITARFAFEQDREVYAIPGAIDSETSIGCNRLIRDQVAKLVTEPEEMMQDLAHLLKPQKKEKNAVVQQSIPKAVLTHTERKVIMVLNEGNAGFETILNQSKFKSAELTHLLLALEFKGVIKQVAGNKYARM